MKQIQKRTLALVMALVMLLGTLVGGVAATEDAEFIGYIQKIEIPDITIPYTDAYRTEDADGTPFMKYSYFYDVYVTLYDNTVLTLSSWNPIEISGMDFWPEISDGQSAVSPWEPGNTYTVRYELCGCSATFDVTVEACPVKSIEVEDTVVMYGSQTKYANSPIATRDDTYFVYAPNYTVVFQDGTKVQASNGIIDGGSDFSIKLEYFDTQRETPWEPGGTYPVTAYFHGVTDTFNVTVVDTCIERIEYEDITVIENAQGCYTYFPEYTVVFKDGTEETFLDEWDALSMDWFGAHLGGYGGGLPTGYRPICTDTQDETPWEPGGTYPVTADFMGFTDTFYVTVVENPIQTITANPAVLTEDPSGWSFDAYVWEGGLNILLKDGTVLQSQGDPVRGGWVEIYGQLYKISDEKMESYPLSPGENVLWIDLSVSGKTYSVEIPVTVEKDTSPDITPDIKVEKLAIDDIRVFASKWRNNYEIRPTYTVTLRDGRVFENCDGFGIDIDGKRDSLEIDTPDTSNWKIGDTYTLTGTFMGVTDTFEVTVIENPIEGFVSTNILYLYPSSLPQYKNMSYDPDTGRFENKAELYFSDSGVFYQDISLQLQDGTAASVLTGEYYSWGTINIYNNLYSVSVDYTSRKPTRLDRYYDYQLIIGGHSYEMKVKFMEWNCQTDGHLYGDAACKICGASKPADAWNTVILNGTVCTYAPGQEVTLDAAPAYTEGDWGYRFAGWSGDVDVVADTGSSTTTFTMPARDIVLEAEYLLIGDANQDGALTLEDSLYVAQMAVENRPVLPEGDIDGDGWITTMDVTYIDWYLAGSYLPMK